VFVDVAGPGHRLAGHTAAVEAGRAWSVRYDVEVDRAWKLRRARVEGRSAGGSRAVTLELDEVGRWRVDGRQRPDLDGCLDVDLESSACTNTFPVHRMGLHVGERAGAPAAYVRALDLSVERLEQEYFRVDGGQEAPLAFDYASPGFDFRARLTFDGSGLVLDYPGIAVRVR
jgi:hypothetical protein